MNNTSSATFQYELDDMLEIEAEFEWEHVEDTTSVTKVTHVWVVLPDKNGNMVKVDVVKYVDQWRIAEKIDNLKSKQEVV